MLTYSHPRLLPSASPAPAAYNAWLGCGCCTWYCPVCCCTCVRPTGGCWNGCVSARCCGSGPGLAAQPLLMLLHFDRERRRSLLLLRLPMLALLLLLVLVLLLLLSLPLLLLLLVLRRLLLLLLRMPLLLLLLLLLV